MNFATVKGITIPNGAVKKIVAAGKTLWEAISYKNWVPFSTTNDGKTIYNGTGYKNGYRIRSGGAEGAHGNGACTGFIPVSGGDVIRISGCTFLVADNGNAINVADASYTNLGQLSMIGADYGILSSTYSAYGYKSVVQESTGVWKWIVPPSASNVANIRVTGYTKSGGNGAALIVTVNEEIN